MKISTKGRYALRMLLDLAQHQNDGYVALKDIARRQNVSKKYLEQIVPMLNKSDILLASRGFQGGYRLAQSPRHQRISRQHHPAGYIGSAAGDFRQRLQHLIKRYRIRFVG